MPSIQSHHICVSKCRIQFWNCATTVRWPWPSKLYWLPWLSWHAHDIAFEIAFEEHSLWSLLELLIYVTDLKRLETRLCAGFPYVLPNPAGVVPWPHDIGNCHELEAFIAIIHSLPVLSSRHRSWYSHRNGLNGHRLIAALAYRRRRSGTFARSTKQVIRTMIGRGLRKGVHH